MTRRRAHPARAAVAIVAAVIALRLTVAVVHDLGVLLPWLAGGAMVLLAWRACRRLLPGSAPRVIRGRAADVTEAGQLRAENAELRQRLAAAEESAHRAQDQAAPDRPRRPVPTARREQLLADRLGGAHDLWERS